MTSHRIKDGIDVQSHSHRILTRYVQERCTTCNQFIKDIFCVYVPDSSWRVTMGLCDRPFIEPRDDALDMGLAEDRGELRYGDDIYVHTV